MFNRSSPLHSLLSAFDQHSGFNSLFRDLQVLRKSSGLRVTASEGHYTYEILVPLNWSASAPFAVTRTLRGPDGETVETFPGLSCLDAPVSVEYQALHARVWAQAQRVLPPELRGGVQQLAQALAPFFAEAELKTAANVAAQSGQAATAPSADTTESDARTAAESEPDFRVFEISRENQPNLRFEAVVLGQVLTLPHGGRGHQLVILKTRGGKYVGVKSGYSLFPGESVRNQVKVAEQLSDLTELFGFSYEAKRLYEQAGVETVETID